MGYRKEARQSTLVYATRPHEDKDDTDVIICMFFIYSVPYFILIDIDSTHSYIANTIFKTTSKISVVSPLGQSVRVDSV